MSGPISHETHRASRRGRKRPFRILLLSAYFPPEIGTASHLFHELAVEFASRGHAVTVATGFPRYNVPPDVAARHRGIWRTEDVDGIRVLRVWWPRFPRRMMIGRGIEHFLAAAAVALRAIASSRPDVLLVYSPPLTLGLSAALLGALRQTRFILNVQDLFPQSAIDLGVMRNRAQIAFFRRMESFIYRQADCVTVHSDGNAEYVSAASGGSAPVAVVPNWVDNRLLEPRPKAPWLLGLGDLRDRFVVSFAGTMGLSQDVETIVRAARLLRDRKDIVFLLVGDGICKHEAQRLARDLRLNNVRFMPMQPREKYPLVLATSDVGLVTLKPAVRTPVVPSKLLSIMASGRPAVVAVDRDGDTPRLVEQVECGLCVPPGDPEGLADAIRTLYRDRDLAKQMGENGRRYARRHLSVKACADIYEQVLAGVVRSAETSTATSPRGAEAHPRHSEITGGSNP